MPMFTPEERQAVTDVLHSLSDEMASQLNEDSIEVTKNILFNVDLPKTSFEYHQGVLNCSRILIGRLVALGYLELAEKAKQSLAAEVEDLEVEAPAGLVLVEMPEEG
jgi:hypothetical protein